MSVTLFELPPPRDLGDGWSLRFLTAGQMLECRDEGEALAGEERDKALWANAVLLARVLLKEGEPAFPDGEAVLASLTVGQMDSLARRWWAQDDFSPQAAREAQADRVEWTTREGGENERFDMARFLALGGSAESPARGFTGEGAPEAGTSGPSVFPELWPGQRPGPGTLPAARGPYREPEVYQKAGAEMPYGMDVPTVEPGKVPGEVFLSLPRKGTEGEEPFRGEHTAVKVLLPETVRAEPGLSVEELDKTVERDARRYDGGLTLL